MASSPPQQQYIPPSASSSSSSSSSLLPLFYPSPNVLPTDDGYETHSSREQIQVEYKCRQCLNTLLTQLNDNIDVDERTGGDTTAAVNGTADTGDDTAENDIQQVNGTSLS